MGKGERRVVKQIEWKSENHCIKLGPERKTNEWTSETIDWNVLNNYHVKTDETNETNETKGAKAGRKKTANRSAERPDERQNENPIESDDND